MSISAPILKRLLKAPAIDRLGERLFDQQARLNKIQPVLPGVEKMLQQKVDELVIANNLKIKPRVVVSPNLSNNAFATGSNIIAIRLGKLADLNHPDELSKTLGHELSHIQHRDSLTGYIDRWLIRGASLITGLVAFQQFSQSANAFRKKHSIGLSAGTGVVTFLSLARLWSRLRMNNETRCDIDALRYLQAAGYSTERVKTSPSQASLIRGITVKELLQAAWYQLMWGQSHPKNAERMAAIDRYLSEFPDAKGSKALFSKAEWNDIKGQVTPLFKTLLKEIENNPKYLHFKV